MRTVTFKSVYDAVLRRHGFDPVSDAVTHDTARAIAEHITERCQTAWATWEWPELMPTEERAYRQVWNATVQYKRTGEDGFADEVYYIPTATYYKVKAGGSDPVVGTVPTNTTFWSVLSPVTTYIGRDQIGRFPMGQVFGVYATNPSLNGCCTQSCLKFRPSEKGITICDGPPATVFVQYLLPEPEYTFVPFVGGGKAYAVGDRVYWTVDGNCYRCIAANNNQTPSNPLFWVLEPVPAMFSTYLKEGAFADCLKETIVSGGGDSTGYGAVAEMQARAARVTAAESLANGYLEGMIDDLLEQGQKYHYVHPRYLHTTWRYDGTIQWPSSGWCCTRPWNGNLVYLISDAPAIGSGGGGSGTLPPLTPGLIYLPTIECLHTSECALSLQAYPTLSLAVDTLAIVTIGTEEQSWRLDPGVVNALDPNQISPSDYNTVTNNKHWTKVSAAGTGGGSGVTAAGDTPLVIGQTYIDVVLPTTQLDANWIFVECSVANTVDPTPLNIWPGITTSKTTTGFRLQLNGTPDTANYVLHWAIAGVSIPVTEADSYLLSGPSSGPKSVASSNFTVALPSSTSVPAPVVVTPNDGGAGGTFTPTTVTLTTAHPSKTFTYTPASYGAKTISVTNGGGLTDPASIAFTSVAATYTLTGPSGGSNLVASTNFTVALPAGGVVVGTLTVTPHDAGTGTAGTFTPTSIALTTAAPSATFIYTPGSTGAKTISATNNGGLTNPGNLTYTVTAPFDPTAIAGLKLWLKADALSLSDGDPVASWADSSGVGNTATQTTAPYRPTYKTAILNGKPIVRFDGVDDYLSTVNGAGGVIAAMTSATSIFVVYKQVGTLTSYHSPVYTSNGTISLRYGFLVDYTGTFSFDFGDVTAGGRLSVAWGGNTTDFFLWSMVAGAGSSAIYRNGTSIASGATTNALSDTSNLNIGFLSGLGVNTCDIAEILLYNVKVSNTDRTDIENYLRTKYGLP